MHWIHATRIGLVSRLGYASLPPDKTLTDPPLYMEMAVVTNREAAELKAWNTDSLRAEVSNLWGIAPRLHQIGVLRERCKLSQRGPCSRSCCCLKFLSCILITPDEATAHLAVLMFPYRVAAVCDVECTTGCHTRSLTPIRSFATYHSAWLSPAARQ